MKRVVLCLRLFAVVIASWAVFARQRRTQTTTGAQTTASSKAGRQRRTSRWWSYATNDGLA